MRFIKFLIYHRTVTMAQLMLRQKTTAVEFLSLLLSLCHAKIKFGPKVWPGISVKEGGAHIFPKSLFLSNSLFFF